MGFYRRHASLGGIRVGTALLKLSLLILLITQTETRTHAGILDAQLCASLCANLRPNQQQQQQQQRHLRQQQHPQLQQQHLLDCGDVHSHPGPSVATNVNTRKVSNPCSSCGKGVTKASKAVSCDSCDRWTHVRCTGSIALATYNKCAQEDGSIAFLCVSCHFMLLPFSGVDVVDGEFVGSAVGATAVPIASRRVSASDPASSSSSSSCQLPRGLNSKGLHFLHSNVRSLLPKIPNFVN